MERYEVSIGKRKPKTDSEPDSTADTAPLVGEVIVPLPQPTPKPSPRPFITLQGKTAQQEPAITPTPSPSWEGKIGDTPEVQADRVADMVLELVDQSLKELYNTDHFEEFRNHLKRRLRRWIDGI
jgi:hypothetical protein